VAHGFMGINGALWEQISGVVLVVAPTVWSMFSHTNAAAIATVAAIPSIKSIIVQTGASDGALTAAQDPASPKVVMTTPTISAAIAASPTK